MYRPPVVREHVEATQYEDEEDGGPFGLETDGNHSAGDKTNDGDENTRNAPFTLKDESEEKEDEENTSSKKEATTMTRVRNLSLTSGTQIRTISCDQCH